MYQDSAGVEDGEYHIMYSPYDSLKLGPVPSSPTIKLATVVQDEQGVMSATGSLSNVTLSAGEALVSSALADSSLAVSSSALTSSSLSGHLAASSQMREGSNPGSSIMTISTVPRESGLGDTDLDDDHLAVATLDSEDNHASQVDMNQIVSTSGQVGIDGSQLVTSSSIDAVVTPVFASDCTAMSVSGTGRKLPQQVIVKLLGDNSISLDIMEQDSHGFNLLTRNGAFVQKFTEGAIISGIGDEQYHAEEVLRSEGNSKGEGEAEGQCSMQLWTCIYCNFAFSSREAAQVHQEKNCTENPALQTHTSQSTVDALMSSPRHDEPTYELKLDRTDKQGTNIAIEGSSAQTDDTEEEEEIKTETVWTCVVCRLDFSDSTKLSDHHLTHTVQDLSSALLKLTEPHQIVRKRKKARSTNTETRGKFPTESLQTLAVTGEHLKWNQECSEVKMTKLEEIVPVVMNPGDTPPSTPPQEKLARKHKRKPGPKARPREKHDRRKYIRKVGENGELLRPREQRPPNTGQGSRDPHSCQICKKVLSSRGNLSKHMVLHEPKKPFVCNICGVSFNAKRDKEHHHMQHHTNVRPNICRICGKGFVDSKYLNEHMVFHKNERPFSCDICHKVFRTSRCVARHKKRHGKDRNFTCTTCNRSFTIKADLASHIRKVHRSVKKNGQQPQQQQYQQHSKTKELGDTGSYILPDRGGDIISDDQLLVNELERKENIFLTDSLSVPTIIPITAAGGGSCPYGIALATPTTQGSGGARDTQTTYIMIGGADGGETTVPHSIPTTSGLLMYTPIPQASHQVGGELEGPGEQLVRVEEGIRPPPPLHTHHHHHHHHSHTPQEGGSLVDDGGTTLSLNPATNPADPTSELPGGEDHDATAPHDPAITHNPVPHNHQTSHDPTSHDPPFPMELLSQTIQLELQRSQASSTPYLA